MPAFFTPQYVVLRPGRIALATVGTILLYLLAGDVWRFASGGAIEDLATRQQFKAVAILLALAILTAQTFLARRWVPSHTGIAAWPALTAVGSGLVQAYLSAVAANWGQNCIGCHPVRNLVLWPLVAGASALVWILAIGRIYDWRRRRRVRRQIDG